MRSEERGHVVPTHTEAAFDFRIQHALQLVVELAGAAHAVLLGHEERAVCVELAAPVPALLAWARSQLEEDALATAFMEDIVTSVGATGFTLDEITYFASRRSAATTALRPQQRSCSAVEVSSRVACPRACCPCSPSTCPQHSARGCSWASGC